MGWENHEIPSFLPHVLAEKLPIQRAVLDRLKDIIRPDVRRATQICQRPCYLEDSIA